MTAEERPHGPPFTVERYGTFGQSVIAERDWLLEEVERLRVDVAHYKQLFENSVIAMDSCACQWEPRPGDPSEHTDKILTLCLAHEEHYKARAVLDVGDQHGG
jgi:hypothetical protein